MGPRWAQIQKDGINNLIKTKTEAVRYGHEDGLPGKAHYIKEFRETSFFNVII